MSALSEQAATVAMLVLEDDPVGRLLIEHEFQGNIYKVESAGDAAAALKLMRGQGTDFQIGIFDLKVPGDTGQAASPEAGLDAIEMARRTFPAMMIITISSIFITEEIQKRLDCAGVKKILSKPFNYEDLHSFVDSLMQ